MERTNAIEFINISKSFGSIKANREISFAVEKGTIHALIGENGAGKSTLMSILFGLYEPDEGIIKVNDKEVLIKGPNDANKLGIGMVHQHFKLVDVYSNLENVVLGDETYNNVTRVINYGPAIEKIKTIQKMFNLHFDLNKKTGTESVATQQKVEIMKMLYRDSEILIFDEPTAVLTDQEIQGLLNTFKLFREQGKTILFISHKLAEIKEVANNATVLRHGQIKGNFRVADVSIEEMAERMVGGEVEIARNEYSDTSKNEVVLSLKNVSTDGEKPLRNVSLDVRKGEIVAIAGVEGNGQTDLEYVISGMIKPVSGEVTLKKTKFTKERENLVSKESKKKNVILTISSLISLYFGIILLYLPSITKDIETLFRVLGGSLVMFGFTLIIVLLLKIYGAKLRVVKNIANLTIKKQTTNKEFRLYKALTIFTFIVGVLSLIVAFLGIGVNPQDSTISVQSFYIVFGFTIAFALLFLIIVSLSLTTKTFFNQKSDNTTQTDMIIQKTKQRRNVVSSILSVVSILTAFASVVILIVLLVSAQSVDSSYVINATNSVLFIPFVALVATSFVFYLLAVITFFVLSADANAAAEKESDYITISDLTVTEISKLGLSFIPSDRHKHGLALDYNIRNNTILRRLWDKRYQKATVLNAKNITTDTADIIDQFDVRGARNGYSISRSLSGGNQQKFIVGREMLTPHDFILILQPTRGLDVGAIKNIHEKIIAEKKAGKAILLISYELDEVLALADKIAVMNTGEILAVKPANQLTRTEIGMYMAHKNEGGAQ
ncbi:ATP-binding cassette domain-containing protein [Mycoplasma sp. Pen4]|uniref:ATP-binding cassette domain-containing protein n=1 Tax=Mycoplasma sp. Pen4 TaxID=640330 RepID=UPI00165414C8|nr:ATP-binding cassette domain-containing protein [Mycoplasma sp. Pen4]QNM93531.1 ATP-binding cassette domain-containing protein [Mycoplasma sp. Pen4]